jgi:hypothetical protein
MYPYPLDFSLPRILSRHIFAAPPGIDLLGLYGKSYSAGVRIILEKKINLWYNIRRLIWRKLKNAMV